MMDGGGSPHTTIFAVVRARRESEHVSGYELSETDLDFRFLLYLPPTYAC